MRGFFARGWCSLKKPPGTEDGEDVVSCRSRLPLAFIATDASSMTYRVPIGLQRGLNVGCFIYLCELSQIKMPLRVIKHGSVPCRPSSCSVKSSNYFHLLPKLFFNSTSPRFRCNSNGPPITSAGVSDIAGNPALLRVKLAQP